MNLFRADRLFRSNGSLRRLMPTTKNPGGTAGMTESPHATLSGTGSMHMPTSDKQARLDIIRALYVGLFNSAISKLPMQISKDDKNTLLSNLLEVAIRVPEPHRLGAEPQETVTQLLNMAEKSGVLVNANGSQYACERSIDKAAVNALQEIYAAVATTMTKVREQVDATSNPEQSNKAPKDLFLEEMETLLRLLKTATDALPDSAGSDRRTVKGKPNKTLFNALTIQCRVLIEGLTNKVTRELSPIADIAELEVQTERMTDRVRQKVTHKNLREFEIKRNRSGTERIIHLNDKLEEIAGVLISNLHESGKSSLSPNDMQHADEADRMPGYTDFQNLQQELRTRINTLQKLASAKPPHTSPLSDAVREPLTSAVDILKRCVEMLARWEKELPKTAI